MIMTRNKELILVQHSHPRVSQMNRLTLKRRDANYIRNKKKLDHYKSNPYHPGHYFINKIFKGYSLSYYGNIITDYMLIPSAKHGKQSDGIPHTEHSCTFAVSQTPKCIVDLCKRYLYDDKDEIHHLAYIIYKSLSELRQTSITKRILNKLIEHYLFSMRNMNLKRYGVDNDDKQKLIQFYCSQLLKSKYLVPVNIKCNKNLLRISMETKLGFDAL